MQFGDLKRETGVFQGQWTIKRVVNLGFSRWASKLEFATHVCIVPTSAVSYEHTRFLINSSLKWLKSMKISDTIRFKTIMIKKQAGPGNDASGLCLSVYWSCDISMERQMDEQTGEKTLKTCWLIICFSVGSHRGQKQPRNAFFAQAWRTDRWTDRPIDGRTDPLIQMRSWRTHLKMASDTEAACKVYNANVNANKPKRSWRIN